MASSAPKRITVIGATSQQGTSVLHSLLRSSTPFALRGTTTSPTSPAALALAEQGVEIVQTSLTSPTSLAEAFADTWGVFLNTNSHIDTVRADETAHASRIADAAKEAGVEVLVYSSLPSMSKLSAGKFPMLAWDRKYAAQEYIRTLGFKCAAFVHAGWYFETLSRNPGFPFTASPSGEYVLQRPAWGEGKIPFIAIERDFGDFARVAFEDPARWNGKIIKAWSWEGSYDGLIAGFQEVTGKRARVEEVSVEEWMPGVPDDTPLGDIRIMLKFIKWRGGVYFDGGNEGGGTREILGRDGASWKEYLKGELERREKEGSKPEYDWGRL